MKDDRTPVWAWVGLCATLAAFALFWLGLDAGLDYLIETRW